MNVSVYLYVNPGGGEQEHLQYPNDYTSEIFQKFGRISKSPNQLVIHRDGDLMYYGYVIKLSPVGYVGFCVVLNGLYVTNIDGVFSIFKRGFEKLLHAGRFLHVSGDKVVATLVLPQKLEEELGGLEPLLSMEFRGLPVAKLPAQSYAGSGRKVVYYAQGVFGIVESTIKDGYVVVCGYSQPKPEVSVGYVKPKKNEEQDEVSVGCVSLIVGLFALLALFWASLAPDVSVRGVSLIVGLVALFVFLRLLRNS